ncbi:MAG: hypothetical protein SW833_26530 [Cyanobacteriota bacterium]|nr:hypothetical protein [Cyanobacteriota bacterium]
MSTYNEILNQIEHLKPDEQLRLIQDLAILVRHRVAANFPNNFQEPSVPDRNLDRWFGFLPKQIDALAFQLQVRQEWDRP